MRNPVNESQFILRGIAMAGSLTAVEFMICRAVGLDNVALMEPFRWREKPVLSCAECWMKIGKPFRWRDDDVSLMIILYEPGSLWVTKCRRIR